MKQKVALVLSGGSARGNAHIGVIEALELNDFKITSIAGTSMGAVVGGVYASGKLPEFKKWMYSLDRYKVFSLIDFTISTHGIIKGEKVFAEMKKFIPDVAIENLNIDFSATAVDILKEKEVVLKEGSLFEAIRASVAIPTVLTPVETKNGLLVDGGVLNNIPISNVQRKEGDILVVVDLNANVPVYKPKISQKQEERNEAIYVKKMKEFQNHFFKYFSNEKEEKLGFFNLINKTISVMMDHMASQVIEKYDSDILIQISRDACGTFDFYRAETMVETGREIAVKQIEFFKKKKSTKYLN